MDREEAVKAVYHIIDWLVNPAQDFETVARHLDELCRDFGTCVKVDEPSRTAVIRALVEVFMEILDRCVNEDKLKREAITGF